MAKKKESGVTDSLKHSHWRMIKALEESEDMQATDFVDHLLLKHHDGSSYSIENCLVAVESSSGLITVFLEHGTPMVFNEGDVFAYKITTQGKRKRPKFRNGAGAG